MTSTQTVMLLLDLALVVVLAAVFGRVARRFGQPAVMGEVSTKPGD